MKNKGILPALLMILATAGCTGDKEILAPVNADTAGYNFESGLTDGWIASTYSDSQAVSALAASAEQAAAGDYSLKMSVQLVAKSANLSKGEAYVDMRRHRPYNTGRVPVSLKNRTVSFWTFVPAELKGELPSAPNGIQVLLKDVNFLNWYSSFIKVADTIATNTWYKIEVPVSTAAGNYGFMDDGFDPENVIIMGVKIGTADAATNVNVVSGMYIDSISWK